MWKVSQFTVVHGLAEYGLPTHNLLLNTCSSHSMVLKAKDWNRILTALDAPHTASTDVQQAIDGLVQARILVGRHVDEQQLFSETFDRIRYGPKRIYPLLTITTACNLGCTYCYEEGVMAETMSMDVVRGALRWMEHRIMQDGIRQVFPGLFGGEPLLYPHMLFAVMDGFRDLCQRHGVVGEFYTSSNGTMLTPELAEKLASKGLTQIQISLDGPEEIHDERRRGPKAQPSYRESLRGIKCAVQHIRNVTVKVNLDRHNRPFVHQLFDTLIEEGVDDLINIKLEAVARPWPASQGLHSPEYVIPPDSVEMADSYLELMVEAQERGLKITKDTAHTTPCMFSSHHGVIIGPDGSMYKCVSLVGRSEFRVGSVFDDCYDMIRYNQQMDVGTRLVECYGERCSYIPVCVGGCAYESIVRTGGYDLRYCTKEFLEAFHYKRCLVKHRRLLETLGMRSFPLRKRRQEGAGTSIGGSRAGRPSACQW